MKKIILEEINRVREIMGLSLITESTPGPKPKTFGGILYSVLANQFKDITSDIGKKRIEQEYINIGQGQNKVITRTESGGVANELERLVEKGASIGDFNNAISKYFTPEQKITLIRNIARNSSEVMDNYIVAVTQLDQQVYDKFTDKVSQGFSLAQQETKDYIKRVAEANSDLYDTKTLETIWSDIESGQFKYADEAGITVPKREEIKNKSNVDVGDEVKIKFNTTDTSFGEDIVNDIINNTVKSDTDEIVDIVIDYAKSPIYKNLRKIYPNMPEKTAKKITQEVIAQVLNKTRMALPRENKEAINLANEVWNRPSFPVSEKEEIIEKALKTVNPRYSFFSKQGLVNYLLAKDITTGKTPIWWKRWLKFAYMNLIGIVLTQVGEFVIFNRKKDWEDLPGEDDAEKISNLLGGWESLAKAALPWHSGLILTGILDGAVNLIGPDNERLFKYLGPDGVNWYQKEGDILRETPVDPAYQKEEFIQVKLKTPDKDGNTDLGVFTYDTDTNQLIQLVRGSDGKYTYNPQEKNQDDSNTSGKYKDDVDSFKEWYKGRGGEFANVDLSKAGKDANGYYVDPSFTKRFVFKNASIGFEKK
jgi:hypothetical protein